MSQESTRREESEGGEDSRSDRKESSHEEREPRDEVTELENSIWLAARAKEGDHEAYGRLLARYYAGVLATVRERMGKRLRRDNDSHDVAQEAMLEAIRDLHRLRIESTAELRALFAVIVENRLRAHARRHQAQMRDRDREELLIHIQDSVASGALVFDPADEEPLPEELLVAAERKWLVEKCILELEERDQLVIRLKLYEEHSWETIALRVGAPTDNAARMAHSRALIRLRGVMEKHGLLDGGE